MLIRWNFAPQVEGLKLAAAQDSMGEAAATVLAELQSETNNMKVSRVVGYNVI